MKTTPVAQSESWEPLPETLLVSYRETLLEAELSSLRSVPGGRRQHNNDISCWLHTRRKVRDQRRQSEGSAALELLVLNAHH